jgi:competence protein ComEC
MLREAALRRVPLFRPHPGEVWRFGDGTALAFVGPLGFVDDPRDEVNENSLVAMLTVPCEAGGHRRILFTGDAGAAAEEQLLAAHLELRADVLKVGHHGSRYSSTPAFIAAVDPTLAVISDGRHNLYHHPAPSTLVTLGRIGARVHRTDLDGGLTVSVDRDCRLRAW